MPYLLPSHPSHPSLLVLDRFDILSSDLPEVPFWPLLSTTLTSPPAATIPTLLDQLETLSLTLRPTTSADYTFLRSFLKQHLSSRDQDRRQFFNHI
jgi:poly(ADP-ribose) glycohydrolase